jgi:predicted helicase
MKIKNKINDIIQQLISLNLNAGVQPAELSNAIFEQSYKSISMEKKSSTLEVFVAFNEEVESKSVSVIMRYTYDFNKCLLQIEQKVGRSKYIEQWNRKIITSQLIDKLSNELLKLNCPRLVNQFISAIPDNFKVTLKSKLKLVA